MKIPEYLMPYIIERYTTKLRKYPPDQLDEELCDILLNESAYEALAAEEINQKYRERRITNGLDRIAPVDMDAP
ncbi:hypothetical protein [Solibaculum mannosilyticum]|uniref:Uncharacterized protein n=1 Tax=Solibaculum mannosilyticum TaxID=2780922 RepID=A0A7I8D873_9FIRM|nr:hypothetical protein [Solibaculum mannosilyticum]BCI60834.1 hypothetical protein C12CBH8_14730 [Solibaculum mannosilyticum]